MDSAKKVGDKDWRERERRDQVPIWRNQEGEEGRRGKTFAPVSPPPSFRRPRRRREGASQVPLPLLRPLPLPMPHRSRKGLDGEGEKKFCLSVGDPRGR